MDLIIKLKQFTKFANFTKYAHGHLTIMIVFLAMFFFPLFTFMTVSNACASGINTFAGTSAASETLLDRTIEKITPHFKDIITEHEKIKILKKKGVKKYAKLNFSFSKKNQKLKIYFIKIIKPDGRIININLNDLTTVTAPVSMSAPVFSNRLMKVVQLPGLSKGSTIDYKFKQTTIKPYMKDNFFTEDYFGGASPLKKSVYKLKIPKGIYYKYAEYSLNEKPEIIKGKKYTTLVWTVLNRKKISHENFTPPLASIIPHVAVSSVKSWNDVASWYSSLTKDVIKPGLSVKNFIKKIEKSRKTRLNKIKAIYDFVATKIRYVGYEFGINGYKPSNVNSIFKNRLGDCKDHATLFTSMLSLIGVKAYPVLIPTLMIPDMNIKLPAPFVFDHEITAIKLKNGHFMFADTTSNVTTFGDLPTMDQGRNVLIIVNGKGIPAKTPVFPPEKNNIFFRESAAIGKNGGIISKLNIKYTGAYDMYKKYMLTSISHRKKLSGVLKTIAAISPEATIIRYAFKNEKSMDKPFLENISFKAKRYAVKSGNVLLFKLPIRVRTILSKITVLKERKYPLVLGYNFSEKDVIKLKIPSGYRLSVKPRNIFIKSAIGYIKAKYLIKGNHILFTSFFAVKGYKIPSSKYLSARKFFNKSIKYLSNQVLIAKKI